MKPLVALVFPRFRHPSGDPPLGLAYLAAALGRSRQASVEIVDATHHPHHGWVRARLEELKPRLVGIYLDTIMMDDGLRIARWARSRGMMVVAGGPHATVAPESVIGEVDALLIGEGESVFPRIVSCLLDGGSLDAIPGLWWRRGDEVVRNPPTRQRPLLDDLPMPAHDLLDMPSYLARWHYFDSISTRIAGTNMVCSRGCPHRCSFCQPALHSLFGGEVRRRSPEHILQEVLMLNGRFGVGALFMQDDTLLTNRAWFRSLCETLIARGRGVLWGCNARVAPVDDADLDLMVRAGLRTWHLGIESASQRILDEQYEKGIRIEDVQPLVDKANRAGIRTLGFFMLGAPTETTRESLRTIRLAARLRIREASFSLTSPMPGSRLHERSAGDLAPAARYASYDYYSRRAFRDGLLGFPRLKALQVYALVRFYAHPYRLPYILGHLGSPRGIRKLARKVQRFFS